MQKTNLCNFAKEKRLNEMLRGIKKRMRENKKRQKQQLNCRHSLCKGSENMEKGEGIAKNTNETTNDEVQKQKLVFELICSRALFR